ncbi:MAG TPA: acetate kinase [Candidatus Faecivivens stercorigallinarum]|nr:acetate kinase [Candidatus Faecivivens stercorigallinarum]
MKILVINAGSSSLKYQLINMDNDEVIAKGNCERIGIDGRITHKTASGYSVTEDCSFPTHTEAFEKVIEKLTSGDGKVVDSVSEISAVGHRVVQGGDIFSKSVIATDEVIDQIEKLSPLAPLHNPAHVLALRACRKVVGDNVPMVAVFDTAFHQTMPSKAFMYGLPYEDYEKYSIRKYGFHGTSHRFVSADFAKRIGKPLDQLKMVTCHLGNGSSITAVDCGKSVDTTMGFTPLDGVIMGTRCGAIDASAVLYLMEKTGMNASEMSNYLNKKCGFFGITGGKSDNRDIEAGIAAGDERCALATNMLSYEIKKQIGAYAAAMGGLDAVVFTGGIGENAIGIRKLSCSDLEFLGIKLDEERNIALNHGEGRISTDDSKVEVWIVPTNEELLIAMDTQALVENQAL